MIKFRKLILNNNIAFFFNETVLYIEKALRGGLIFLSADISLESLPSDLREACVGGVEHRCVKSSQLTGVKERKAHQPPQNTPLTDRQTHTHVDSSVCVSIFAHEINLVGGDPPSRNDNAFGRSFFLVTVVGHAPRPDPHWRRRRR